MFGHLYPNLVLAQAKSSLKYRIASVDGTDGRPRSPEHEQASPPSRRRRHVPALAHAQSETTIAFFDDGSPISEGNHTAVGRRRRRVERSPSPSSECRCHRSASMSDDIGRVMTASSNSPIHSAVTHDSSNSPPRLPPALVRKLEAIDHIIARANGEESVTEETKSPSPLRRASNGPVLDPLAINSPVRSPSRRKIAFLMKQDSVSRPIPPALESQESSSPSEKVGGRTTAAIPAVPSIHQMSTKYLITVPDTAGRPALAPIPVKQDSQRVLNNARVMEFVDAANNKPLSTTTIPLPGAPTIRLDKQLRRISLVSFEQAGGNTAAVQRIITRSNSSLAMRRKQMFGIYSIREVMAVIRLFWFLDADRSGGITLDELHLHRDFFTQLGRNDLGAVFHELDVDGNGSIALNELLRVCFRHANDHQLQAMLTLAKVGDLGEYLTGRHSAHTAERKAPDEAENARRKELLEIFHVFDRNGDGKINRDELLEALEIDRDMFAPALETSRGAWAENARRMERAQAGGLTKEDIDRFYADFDKNSDDVLDMDEFFKLMDAVST